MPLTENQTRFIAALRSGEYEQIRGCLMASNRPGKCCCTLGVAMDLFHVGERIPSASLHANGVRSTNFVNDEDENRSWLSDAVTKKLGLYGCTGLPTSTQESVMVLNDNYGWSFTQIADHLEAHAEEYFV